MSSWANVIKNVKKQPIKEKEKVESNKEDEDSKDDKDDMMKLYKSLGYEDPEYEFDSKYGGDIIDIHIMLQDLCEEMSFDVYQNDCINKFTDYIKKNSSAYTYFVEDILDEYNINHKGDDSENEND